MSFVRQGVKGGLPPALAAGVVVLLLGTTGLLVWTARWHGRERMLGSVVLTALTGAVVAAVVAWGHANLPDFVLAAVPESLCGTALRGRW